MAFWLVNGIVDAFMFPLTLFLCEVYSALYDSPVGDLSGVSLGFRRSEELVLLVARCVMGVPPPPGWWLVAHS